MAEHCPPHIWREDVETDIKTLTKYIKYTTTQKQSQKLRKLVDKFQKICKSRIERFYKEKQNHINELEKKLFQLKSSNLDPMFQELTKMKDCICIERENLKILKKICTTQHESQQLCILLEQYDKLYKNCMELYKNCVETIYRVKRNEINELKKQYSRLGKEIKSKPIGINIILSLLCKSGLSQLSQQQVEHKLDIHMELVSKYSFNDVKLQRKEMRKVLKRIRKNIVEKLFMVSCAIVRGTCYAVYGLSLIHI